MTRPVVHAASGHRLGAADPHQEGPADLRLVAPALAAWATAALTVIAPGRWAIATVLVLLCAVAALLVSEPAGRAARPAYHRRGRDAAVRCRRRRIRRTARRRYPTRPGARTGPPNPPGSLRS